MKRVISALALVVSFNSQAQEVPFFFGNEDTIFRVGQTTKSFNNGPVMTTWLKIVNKFQDKYSMNLVQVHCPSGMYKVLKYAEYVNGGYLKVNDEIPGPWVHATPGTLGDNLKELCR